MPNSAFERMIETSSRRGGGTDLILPTRMMAGRDPQGPVLGSEAVVQASPCATRAACRVSPTGGQVEVPNPRNWVTVEIDPPRRRGGDQDLDSPSRVTTDCDRQRTLLGQATVVHADSSHAELHARFRSKRTTPRYRTRQSSRFSRSTYAAAVSKTSLSHRV